MVAQFLTIPEVARVLRVGERTAYALARSGKLAGALKVGSQWRVSRTAFREWAAAREAGSARRRGPARVRTPRS